MNVLVKASEPLKTGRLTTTAGREHRSGVSSRPTRRNDGQHATRLAVYLAADINPADDRPASGSIKWRQPN